MTRDTRRRPAFTLVELLVAMAIIIALASIALMVVPGALDQDRTVDSATQVRQWLMIAKARAARDGSPRGVRLLIANDPQNPFKSAARGNFGALLVTECQYTESPPVMVPNPTGDGNITAVPAPARVQFIYTQNQGGVVTNRVCSLVGLTADQTATLLATTPGTILYLPLLGTWHRVTRFHFQNPFPGLVADLDYYPDAALGAAASPTTPPSPPNQPCYVTYHFGLYLTPQPLIGEPTLPLPRNSCVDLNHGMSRPDATVGGIGTELFQGFYDIVFAPNGSVLFRSDAQMLLWVRDYTKASPTTPVPWFNGNLNPPPAGSPPQYSYNPGHLDFRKAGEMQLVSLKSKSGALGVFPVRLPPGAPGTMVYAAGNTPYDFAYRGASE